jgi:hypothetical protein
VGAGALTFRAAAQRGSGTSLSAHESPLLALVSGTQRARLVIRSYVRVEEYMQIEDSAYRPLRVFLSEQIVAAWRQEQGGTPVHRGGGCRGYDVEDGDMLLDAKSLVSTVASERRAWPGHDYKVFRQNHQPFDPSKTTHLALVALPRDMAIQVGCDGGRMSITASCGRASIFLVPTDEFNAQLEPGCGGRIVPLATEWLERHRVQ